MTVYILMREDYSNLPETYVDLYGYTSDADKAVEWLSQNECCSEFEKFLIQKFSKEWESLDDY